MMKRYFPALLVLASVMFATAPFLIAWAPYESTMLLVQKIFYFHAPSGMVMLLSGLICGVASGVFLWKKSVPADRIALAAGELTALFGLIVMTTGPLWGRKSWGVWWQWDARLTMSFIGWMVSLAYLLVRKYGGLGSDKLAAAVALFGAANVPFVYLSVNIWRTIHPTTNVAPSLPPGMREPFWFCVLSLLTLYAVLMMARVRLEQQRAQLDEVFLAHEEQ